MRLAHKLSLAQLVLICVILFVNAEVQLRREIRLFDLDMRRDHHVSGAALAATVADAWKSMGWSRARRLVYDADAAEKSVDINWIWLEGDSARVFPDPRSAAFQSALLAGGSAWIDSLLLGHEVVRVEHLSKGPGDLATYEPVRISGAPAGAIRISESLREEKQFVHTTILHMAVTTTLIAIGAVTISILFGSSIIVQPMSELVGQARRIGQGDLSQRLQLEQHDEIGVLAGEMNRDVRTPPGSG